MTGSVAISARGLSKNFGDVRAVADIDLEVRRGEIYGFLGRNGAGKTTTIRMLLGLVRPSAGEISIMGSSLKEDRENILARVGFLVESPAAYPNLTVRENLDIQRRLTGAPSGAADEVIDLLKLGEYGDRRAGRLSLGNKQRLSLARALIHSPEILILDEPANGLDPAGIIEIRDLLRGLADDRSATIFMSSHLLDEVAQLADRVGIIHEGKLIEEVDYRELRELGKKSIIVAVDDADKAEKILRESLGFAEVSRPDAKSLRVSDRGAEPAAIARALVGAGLSLERLGAEEEDLERHFMRLTGGAA
ncbi:MAG: ABC transporter ATP-binding protein [Spirochaetia bacterium]|jgi:ABC-2 type transport system ATP-binding protein|nr:ABC transporter ATP-binding protein [Spirochaetia bacterium]